MAKVMVPIVKLKYADADAVTNGVLDVFEDAGVWNREEDFTFTGRVAVLEEDAEKREAVRAQLKERFGDEVTGLLQVLDEHHWDVSFFVDCY